MFILTVEDEFLISEYLRGILEAAGHNVVATFDAEDGHITHYIRRVMGTTERVEVQFSLKKPQEPS